jgi:DNA-binding NarL/FixJ family response regulator
MPAKLLIIDNTTAITNPWKKALQSRFQTSEAMGGVEAVRKLKTEPISLVIVNISLRQINGVEAIAKIRSSFDRIPIIILHDQRDVLDLKQAKAYSINGIVALPVDYKKLVAEIQKVLPKDEPEKGSPREEKESVPEQKPAANNAHATDDPNDVEKRFYEGLTAISANNIKKAIGIFQSLISITRLKKESWRRYLEDALFQLGQCHAALGEFEKSNSCYAAFITKAPHNTSHKSALLYMGKNYIALKNYAKAAHYLNKVITAGPADSFNTQARKLLKSIETMK